MPAIALVSVAMVAACNDCDPPKPSKDADAPAPVEASVDAAPPVIVDASRPVDAAPIDAATTLDDVDAGPSACRLAYGPAEQPFRGPAALITTPTEIRLIANDSGKPRTFPITIANPPPATKPSSFSGMRWPPCEIAGRWAYCSAPGGAITRSTVEGGEAKEIVKGRAGSRIAAAALGKDHSVVGYLVKKQTTEGEQLQAFAVVDDGEPARLSEDGSGATSLRLVPHGDEALAIYIDTRTSMVPIHVRPVAAKGNTLAPGADVVLHVAGPPERGIDFAVTGITGGAGSMFVLLPNAKDTAIFGMAAIPIADPPKLDEQPVWSTYPNGLDPAPIAATTSAKGSFVARVRPREAMPGSLRVLELGKIDSKGAFTSLGVIAQGENARHITDIAMTTDATGALWILYGDTTITWLERRVCP